MSRSIYLMQIRILVSVLIILMLGTMCISPAFVVHGIDNEAAQTKPGNPTINGSGTVTWDCVYFGKYPQSKNGTGYNNEPIKWRVLSVTGDEAFLLADRSLDRSCFYPQLSKNTWDKSTLRRWLNGYGSGYAADNFIDKAFCAEEQNALYAKTVETEPNPIYGSPGGSDTTDKITLLSIEDLTNTAYGFPNDNQYSETRISSQTAYSAAKEGGIEGDTDWWWMRSMGQNGPMAASSEISQSFSCTNCLAVRPAIYLDLSSDLWKSAGKVSSVGWRNNSEKALQEEQTIIAEDEYIKTSDCVGFTLLATSKTYRTYESSNPEVATINSSGYIAIRGVGITTFTITAAETEKYKGAVKRIKLTVKENQERRILKSPTVDNNGTVTWDCVYMGHYPQNADGNGGFSNDRIKWRVLSVNDNEALLVSDKILESKKFNEAYYKIRWEFSTVRSWLNGYGAEKNDEMVDYSANNFINKAFTDSEQDAINKKTLKNYGDDYYKVDNGNDTEDKIFLLTLEDVTNSAYGFTKEYNMDVAREAEATDYLKNINKGILVDSQFADNWTWRLRSPGHSNNGYYAALVGIGGSVDHNGFDKDTEPFIGGVRPAFYINVSSEKWEYAGTVSIRNNTGSNSESERAPQSIICSTIFEKVCGCAPFDLMATAQTPLTYESSNPDVATVTSDGTVTVKGSGMADITVMAIGTTEYKATVKRITIKAAKAKQTITGSKSFTKTFAYNTFYLGAAADTELTYKSSNTNIATVSSAGKVTLKNPGKAYITVTAVASPLYEETVEKVAVNSALKRPSLSATAQKGRKIKLSWSKVTGASGYKIYLYSTTSKKYVCKLTKSSKVKSVTHSGLKANKKYKYVVRAYRYVKGKAVYSTYSPSKTVKARR